MSAPASTLRHDAHVIGFVGIAHGFSHFFQLMLPPLFPILKEELATGYADLGLVMAVFYAVSGLMQTVAGFLVDRWGAHRILVLGLAFAAVGTMAYAIAPSYPFLIVGAVIAGLGNSVFHPGDLALLNAKVSTPRLGHAFSVHGIGGNLGWAAAPVFTVAMSAAFGWRAALVAAGVIGLAFTALFALQGALRLRGAAASAFAGTRVLARDLHALTRPAIVLCFLFFLLYSMALVGYQTFSVPAMTAIYAVPIVTATAALTTFLLGGAAGILFGGWVATRTNRHARVAALGMLLAAVFSFLLAPGQVPPALLSVVIAAVGFFLGMIGPSRDILVREAAPVDARGKVYGFVYSGLDLGGLIAPLAFGVALDRGAPWVVFAGAAAFMLLAVPTALRVVGGRRVLAVPA
jgi:MFS family permease